MSLADALAADVPESTRTKGRRYFLGGAVRAIEGSDTRVTATVRGTRWYQVQLARDGQEVRASCECPFYTDRNDFCKHIWAVILAADAEGFLIGTTTPEDLYLETAYDPSLRGSIAARDPGRAEVREGPAESWKRFLYAVQHRTTTASPSRPSRYAHGEVLYVVDAEATRRESMLVLQVQWRTRKKNGEWGKPQPAALTPGEIEGLREEADREILSLLLGAADQQALGNLASASARATFRPAGPLLERVLPLLARSGRLYLDSAESGRRSPRPAALDAAGGADAARALTWDDGQPWTFRLEVRPAADGFMRVDGALEREGDRMPVTQPALILGSSYLVVQGAVARLESGGGLAWLVEIRESGPALVPEDAADDLVEALARSNVEPAALPPSLRYEVIDVPPQRRVRISRAARPPGQASRDELEAIVEFDYGGSVLQARAEPAAYDPERRRMIRRHTQVEAAAVQRLQKLGFHRPWYLERSEGTLSIAVERFPDAVRALVEEGWHVEAEGRAFRGAKKLQLQVKSGIDWFELHGRADFGDGRSASIAELLAALRRGDAAVLLDDGSRGLVPEEWLRRYARVAGFGEARGSHVRYRISQTALLDALLESQPAVSIDETFARIREELARFSGVRPIDAPSTFRGQLRDYQREALGWFAFLRRFGFGGCLADDMGLGKTVMVLALLDSRRLSREPDAPRTSVAVVPRSLVFNWIEEAARFAPELRILDYTGQDRADAAIGDHDLLLTTYGTLRRDAPRLAEHAFDYVILDEAQAIKNASTAAAKAARLLRGRHKLALSGTPIENHLGELWSLFEFLNPGLLGTAASFGRAVPQPGRADRVDLELVARALRPFILRRTKEQVAPELPEKVEQTIHCELETAQRRLYDELRGHYREQLLATVARQGMNRSKLQVLEALLRLRQAASHPGLVDPARNSDASAKFDVLVPRLHEIIDEGHKALVFSQFTTLLGLLRERLDGERITYEYLDGRTRDRAERVSRFERDPSCSVFLISLKAGGVGLNLTAADYVFLLDPWWNPAAEAQAIDRAHRIGQSKHVFAYRLIARDTVEEKIAELQETKRELADAIFAEDAGLIRTLRSEDLDWLFS